MQPVMLFAMSEITSLVYMTACFFGICSHLVQLVHSHINLLLECYKIIHVCMCPHIDVSLINMYTKPYWSL